MIRAFTRTDATLIQGPYLGFSYNTAQIVVDMGSKNKLELWPSHAKCGIEQVTINEIKHYEDEMLSK